MVAGYNVLEQIGEGGMATIFRARHSILERDVALKKIKKPVKESIDRFRQEAKLSARLNHENIVSIYDFIREGRSYFLVMEYINGIDFRNILEIASPVPPHEAARVIHEVANGLEYAHFKRVIHRDIKPSNILLSQAGDVKIIDFGVAKTHDSAALTSTGIIIGTPSYLPPEYIDGQELTPQSDVYSLGVVLYELLTGFKPFIAAGNAELIIAISKGKYKAPRKYNRAIPLRLQQIIRRAMHANPNKRYANMAEFALALAKFIGRETPSQIKAGLQEYYGKVAADRDRQKYDTAREYNEALADSGGRRSVKRLLLAAALAILLPLFAYGVYFYLENDYFARLQIKVKQVPAGEVTVWLDKDPVGKTLDGHLLLTFINTGQRNIRLSAGANYQSYERFAQLRSGKTKVIPVVLNKREEPAELLIDSVPQGAEVKWNDKRLGFTPLRNRTIRPGTGKLSLLLPNYRTFSVPRDFNAGERLTLFIEMEKN
jgi:tRNA A-37 threonylcarbamoyl transferase component Bud32